MRNRLFASLFVVVALIFGVTNSASADQWDYIYGEDPTNANNVSVNLDIKIDPLGGVYIIGYFFGQFEGLQSGSDFARFVQHRSAAGTVDWTISYMSEPSSTVPARTFAASVDGNGTLFINSKPSYLATRWFSIDREGHVVEKLSPADFSCPVGVAAQDGGVIGICGGTSVMLRKVDENFQLIWEKQVEQYIDTTSPTLIAREFVYGDFDEQIIQGANSSIWVIDGLNYNNFSQTQNNLPLSLRSALAMTSFDATTGEKLVAIKHYGLLPLKAISIGEREVWMSVKTLDTSACYLGDCSEEHLNAIFDSSNGAMKGYTSGNFGLFPRFARFILVTEGYNYLFDNGFTSTKNLGTDPDGMSKPDWCIIKPFHWGSRSWVGAQNEGFDGFNSGDCSAQATWSTFITNDGRRLIMAVNNQLAVWEITGTNLPTIGRLISRQTFASKIQAVDADNLGNIYVVGSTFETRVIQSNELLQPAANIQTQSLSANRAFISRNPMGRISLDVLPRTPLRIKVAGINGIPATGVGAVSMNVTVTSPDGEGFITVYPCDSKPDASNLNYTLEQTVPNAVIAPVSSTGDVCFYTYAKTHLIADVNGYFPTGSGFVSNTPARVIDTRVGSAQGLRTVSKTKVGNGTELRVQLTNLPGGITPATGVGAVSLNVTVTGSRAPSEGGFVTVYPCGNRPDASNLNFQSGQTVPNAVITPVSSNGEVCFYVYGSADLIADINGYFPGGAGFVATEPVRVADTRSGSAQGLRTVTKQRIGGNTTLQLQLTNLPGGITPSSGIGAVSLNVTAVNTTADKFGGYVTTYPCGSIPDVSSLNFVSNQIVPNAVIAPLSANGTICFFAYGQTDLIVDLNGYFPTGAGFTPMSPVRLFDTR